MTNSNIIADIREREARGRAAAQKEYWLTVERVAANGSVKATAVEKAITDAGRTVEDFAEHVRLAKAVHEAQANAEEHDLPALVLAEQEADRQHRKLIARHKEIIEKELPAEEQAAMQAVRVAESKVKRARKDIAAYHAEMARLRQAKGEEDERPTVAVEEPRLVVSQRRIASNRPQLDPSLWDHYVRDNGTTYFKNKNTGEVVE